MKLKAWLPESRPLRKSIPAATYTRNSSTINTRKIPGETAVARLLKACSLSTARSRASKMAQSISMNENRQMNKSITSWSTDDKLSFKGRAIVTKVHVNDKSNVFI